MPELPEVETIRRDLAGMVAGKSVARVEIKDIRALQGFSPSGAPRRRVTARQFQAHLLGQKIKTIGRRGKYLLFHLSSGKTLLAHLRMTGQLIFSDPRPDARVRIFFSDAASVLNFCDTRRFGEMWMAEDWRLDPSILALGPEPLEKDIDGEAWARTMRASRAKVQSALLDQKLLAGVGNIYATEALFRSGIRPTRRCTRLRADEMPGLLKNIRAVLEEGLSGRGVSFRNYRDARGERGQARERLAVYGRENQPCLQCGRLLTFLKVNGRGTVCCFGCQK